MDINTGGNGSSSAADQSLCAPLLAELQLDTFAFDANATCAASSTFPPIYHLRITYYLLTTHLL